MAAYLQRFYSSVKDGEQGSKGAREQGSKGAKNRKP
jgi:hypothetical protein